LNNQSFNGHVAVLIIQQSVTSSVMRDIARVAPH
jgi:hypothetical protein